MSESVTNRTQLKSTLNVNRKQLKQIIEMSAVINIDKLNVDISTLFEEMRPALDKTFVMIKNKKVWFDRNNAAFYPKFEEFKLPTLCTSGQPSRTYSLDFEGFHFVAMTRSECQKSFTLNSNNPYLKSDGHFKHFLIRENMILTGEPDGSKMYYFNSNGSYGSWNDNDQITVVPICRLKGKNSSRMNFSEAVLTWLSTGLVPEGLNDELERKYIDILNNYSAIYQYLEIDQDKLYVKSDTLKANILSGRFKGNILGYNFDLDKTLEDICEEREKFTGSVQALREELLNCDWKRANLHPYEDNRLTDINLGHWELFEPRVDGEVVIELPKDEVFVARPPHMDIMTDGTCAIDFGTKSTVVVCRNRDARLLRIGEGDYSKAPTMLDYENPTVIELCDVEAFFEAYNSRRGRPYTEWKQIKVSHEAAKALFDNTEDSSIYDSVFGELKQWVNSKDKRLRLQDHKGYIIELKPYCELQDDDFDPIEIYAYYLGLYINNMHNRIYLDYILSFPVTYAKDVREHIRNSFERGIKKSLPPALVNNSEIMEQFRVHAGASEPAAYAISALHEFGLEPKETDTKVAYGVFDFGGGTTDFDFGIEEVPSNHKRKFIIRRFGAGGDPYLGGENILDLLAYEVFKDNLEVMRNGKIAFALPPYCTKPSGTETLILEEGDAPNQAKMNRKRLASEMRRIWEHHDDIDIFNKGDFSMHLFTSDKNDDKMSNGSLLVEVGLNVNVEKLEKIIENRIRRGVENFFTALIQAFQNKAIKPIHIFLAGNSCKAPIVKKLFEEAIKVYEVRIAEGLLQGLEQEKDTKGDGVFKLHLPLGVKESDLQIESDNKTIADDNSTNDSNTIAEIDFDQMRTGKTGVAFGLLRTRIGGKDVKIIDEDISLDNEVIFPYYLGDIDRDGHFEVLIGLKVPYGEWTKFAYADETEFELYYTKEPKALDSQLTESEVNRVRCRIDSADISDDDNIQVYIRKVSPDSIEYAIGTANDFNRGDFQGKIYRKQLK